VVDVLGLILAVAVTGANMQDRDGGQLVLKGLKDRFPRLARVWANGVYAGRLVEWAEKTAQFVLDIVCKPRGQIGFSVLPWRWIVERTFAWLGNYRRLARDYEISPRTSHCRSHFDVLRLFPWRSLWGTSRRSLRATLHYRSGYRAHRGRSSVLALQGGE
jgi:transposase